MTHQPLRFVRSHRAPRSRRGKIGYAIGWTIGAILFLVCCCGGMLIA